MKKLILLFVLLCSSILWAKGTNEESVQSVPETLESYPQRIISLSPSTTETLFAIGAGDQVIGVTSYCDYPAEAATREIIGGFSANTISIETIISLNPDLVIAGVSAHQPIAETLKSAGIPVLSIEPKSVEEIKAVIEELAIITGHKEQGKLLSEDITNRINYVTDRLSTLGEKNKVKVFYEVWDAPLMTAGPNSFTGQLISYGGGNNIFSDVEGEYPQVSSEELISRNPQAILSSDTHGDMLTIEAMGSREGWKNIDAFKKNNVILLDGNIVSRPGPRVIDAIEMIASALYPDLF
ncbi:MAG: cobalamin-binding protein [Spirochaetaceae bacterium]|nr:cobalamin-binding protein [Spirochaetaceae bacterium]